MAQVDIGTETYDSFASVDEADVYLAGDVMRSTGWALRNPDAKGRGLVSATRLLLGLPWVAPAPTVDDDDLPPVIAEITAELAADLLAKPTLLADATGNTNVKSAKAGSAAVEFFRPVDNGPAIPRSMWDRLRSAGLVSTTGTGGNAGAIVTGLNGRRRPYCGRPAWDYPVAATDYD
jgi:hypothetical protein